MRTLLHPKPFTKLRLHLTANISDRHGSTQRLFQTNNNNDMLIMVLNYTPKRDSFPNNQSITHQHCANAFRIRLLHWIFALIPDIMVRCSLFSKLHDTLQSSLRYDIQFHYFLVIQTIVSS